MRSDPMMRTPPPEVMTRHNAVVDLINPKPADIRLADVDHALNRIVRFTGHTTVPWSVAQHSVLVAAIAAVRYKATPAQVVAALLHDAHEAYIGDIPAPVARALTALLPQAGLAIDVLKQNLQRAIHLALGMPAFPDSATATLICAADADALTTEASHLMHDHCDWWTGSGRVVSWAVVCQNGPAVMPGSADISNRLYEVGLTYRPTEGAGPSFLPFDAAVRRVVARAGFTPLHPCNQPRAEDKLT